VKLLNGYKSSLIDIFFQCIYKALYQEEDQESRGDNVPNCCSDEKALFKDAKRVEVVLYFSI